MNKRLSIEFVLLMCLVSACNSQAAGIGGQETTTSMPRVAITVEEVPPELYPSPTPVICTSIPQGMTLTAKPVSATAVQLEITGLQPGEHLTYILRAQSDGHILRMEGHPVLTADSNGRYVEVVNSLPPEMKHWMIQVIHSGGVACTEVDLP